MSGSGGHEPPSREQSRQARREAFARGRAAESWVASVLQDEGWRVLARNWQGGGAELDIVVERDGCVRFVEVKARGANDATGFEAITADKRARLRRGAEAWLDAFGEPRVECAFLIVVATPTADGWDLELMDDAF